MKTIKANFWIILIALSFGFASCNSDDNEPEQQTQTNPTPDVPGDANGVLAAIKVITNLPAGTPTVPGISDITLDVASGSFFEGAQGSSLVNVGVVSLNGNQLQNIGSNAYINNPTQLNAGIISGQTNSWEVGGANGFAAFTHTTAKRMPSQVKFAANVGDTFSKSGAVTLTIQAIPSNIDNILWVISDGNKVLTKEARSTSVTFDASEMSTLSASSTSLVQVAAYNTEGQTFGGKKIYFINETVDSKNVEIN